MNPYASPATEPVTQPIRLYSPQQVAGAAFLGTPIAAAWLFARNFSALGDERASRRALVWGVVGTVAIVVLGSILPARFPAPVLPIAYTMALRELAKLVHGAAFAAHVAAGGQRQSNWRVLGIGLAGLVAVLPFAVGLAFVLPTE